MSPEGLAASGAVTFLPHGSDEAPSEIALWHDNIPLTPGQEQHVNHLLHVETDILAREVLITVKREGMPPRSQWSQFMTQYALWSWYAESDALAWATLAKIEYSDWDEMLGFADEEVVETAAQDLGNNTREGLVIIDADSGETLLERIGVVGEDGGQHVGLQDAEVEALRGRRLIFVHNHPNGPGASAADRVSAFAAGSELLLVITGDGREGVYLRGRDRMALVRDGQASYEVGSPMLGETIALAKKSAEEARRYREDRPELVFRQAEPGFIDRLTDATRQLDLDDTLPVSDLIDRVLDKAENDLAGFQRAAAAFYGHAEIHHSHTMDFHDLLNGALPYWRTAEATGVDPALLAQLVLWETPHWSRFWEHSNYGLMYGLGLQSFGIAQIKVDTATEMLDRYLDRFADLGSVSSGIRDETQSWDEYEVGWALFSNEEFSIRVAGAYLMDFETRLRPYLRKHGVAVSDAEIDEPHISEHELRLLAVVGYNQGWGQALARLADLANDRAQSNIKPDVDPVVEGVRRTISNDYARNVLSMESEALEKYGLSYRGSRNED